MPNTDARQTADSHRPVEVRCGPARHSGRITRKGEGVLFTDLTGLVKAHLSPDNLAELGTPMWYVTTVKLELEVRGEIRRVKDATPQRLLRIR